MESLEENGLADLGVVDGKSGVVKTNGNKRVRACLLKGHENTYENFDVPILLAAANRSIKQSKKMAGRAVVLAAF